MPLFAILSVIARYREKGITSKDAHKEIKGDSKLFTRRVNALHSMGYLEKYELPVKNGRLFMLVHSKFAQHHEGFSTNDILAPIEIPKLYSSIVRLIQDSKTGFRSIPHLWKDLAFPNSMSGKCAFMMALHQLSNKGNIKLYSLLDQSTNRRHFCAKFLKPLSLSDQDIDFVEDKLDTTFNDFEEEGRPKFPPELGSEPHDFQSLIPRPLSRASRERILFNIYYPMEAQQCYIVGSTGTTGVQDSDILVALTGTTYEPLNTRLLELLTSNKSKAAAANKKLEKLLKSALGYLSIVRGVDYVEFKRNFRYFTNYYFAQIQKTGTEPAWGTFQDLPSFMSDLADVEKKFFIRIPGSVSVVVTPEGIKELIYFGDSKRAAGASRQSSERLPSHVNGNKSLMKKVAARSRVSTLVEDVTDTAPQTPSNPPASTPVHEPLVIKPPDPSPLVNKNIEVKPPDFPSLPSDNVVSSDDEVIPKIEPDDDQPGLKRKPSVVIEASLTKRLNTDTTSSGPSIEPSQTTQQDSASAPTQELSAAEAEQSFEPIEDERTRQNFRLLEILQNNGNVMPNLDLLTEYNNTFGDNETSSIGKRGLLRIIKRLSKDGYVRQLYVVVPFAEVEHHATVAVLAHKSISDDSSRLAAVKSRVLEKTRLEAKEKAERKAKEAEINKRRSEEYQLRRLLQRQMAEKRKSRQLKEAEERRRARLQATGVRSRTKAARSRTVQKSYSKMFEKDFWTKIKRYEDPTPLYDAFFRVVVIARSLYGGALNIINWDKVSVHLHGCSTLYLKRLWSQVQRHFGSPNIDLIMKSWERTFLQAYERREIPVIKNGQYDLLQLAEYWAEKNPEITREFNVPLLYEERADNEEKYNFTAEKLDLKNNVWYTATTYKELDRELTNWPAATRKVSEPAAFLSDIIKAKTAILSIIATPQKTYDSARAKTLLQKFGEDVCVAAIEELEKDRVVVYIPRNREAVRPERNFAFSERVKNLLTPELGLDAFAEVTEFYQSVVETLNGSNGFIMSPLAPDYSMICVLDMVCHEKVDLVRVQVRDSPALDEWTSNIVVRTPLDSIDPATGPAVVEELQRSKKRSVPVDEPGTYIWTDVGGRANRDMWYKLCYWTLMTMESHPGITTDILAGQIGFLLSRKEVHRLIKWLLKKNIVRKGSDKGYWVLPEWYAKIPF